MLLAAALVACSADRAAESQQSSTEATTSTVSPTSVEPVVPRPRTIAEENALPGSPGWAPPDDPAVVTKVSGWLDQLSAERGATVGAYVSTSAATFHIEAVRLGWYGGAAGRVVWRSAEVPGVVQPPPRIDPTTNMRDAPWTKSTDITIDHDWTPGVFVFKLVSSDGGQSMMPLVVRDDSSRASILIGSAVTTWQAYNGWGDANLYTGGSPPDVKKRSKVVSFDRPYAMNGGTGELFGREDWLLYMVESMGLDVTYTTDLDVDARPELLTNHRVYIIPTHDEYWTKAMRDGVEAARDKGVNLIFMGANAVYRRIRLEPSAIGPQRQQVNYRVAKDDPLYGVDDEQVTTSWRESPHARPESSLIGQQYECNPVDAPMVIVKASSWIFEGTGLQNGDKLPHIVLGEYDRVMPDSPTPENVEVVAHSPLTCGGRRSFADMTYYTAPSGAGVLATGTFGWEPRLGPPCHVDQMDQVDCQIRHAMVNVLRVFASGPAGVVHPSQSNLAELGIRAGSATAN